MMNRLLIFIFLVFGCLNTFGQHREESYLPGKYPDRIIMNLGPSSNSRIVTWRVNTAAGEQFIQWALSDASSNLSENARLESAISSKVNTENIEVIYSHFTFENLEQGKTYVYRVGNEGAWSEWLQFQMPDQTDGYSFVSMGDAQNDMRDLWSRSMRMSLIYNPKADFWIHLGDMVDNSGNNWEWGEWFYAGGWIMASFPQVLVPGNHEYVKKDKRPVLCEFWRASFSLPENGPKGLKEQAYYFDYQNTRFIVLDSRDMLLSDEKATVQAEWLESILQNNPQKWTVVSHHHPIHSARGNRGDYRIKKYLEPLYNQYKIDLVLQGHHHSFARGRNPEEIGQKNFDGPVYIVSNSGPKMYDSNFAPWMERVATNVQMFHTINVNDKKIEVLSYLVNGDLYDHIVITKKANGKKILKEIKLENVKEQLDFPEASYGADIDKSPESQKLFKKRVEIYLKNRKKRK